MNLVQCWVLFRWDGLATLGSTNDPGLCEECLIVHTSYCVTKTQLLQILHDLVCVCVWGGAQEAHQVSFMWLCPRSGAWFEWTLMSCVPSPLTSCHTSVWDVCACLLALTLSWGLTRRFCCSSLVDHWWRGTRALFDSFACVIVTGWMMSLWRFLCVWARLWWGSQFAYDVTEHLCCFPVEAEAQLQELVRALLPCTKEVRTDQRSPPDFSSVDSVHCF